MSVGAGPDQQSSRCERRRFVIGCAVGILCQVVLAYILVVLRPMLPLSDFPTPYLLIVMWIAYVFDLGPAIICAFVGWIAFDLYFVPPVHSLWPLAVERQGWAKQVAFILSAPVVTAAALQAARSKRRVQQLADEAIALNAELEQRVAQRTQQLDAALQQERTARSDAKVAEARTKSWLELAPDGIIVANKDGTIAFSNTRAVEMFGYEPGELIGQPVELLMPERYRQRHIGLRNDYMVNPRTRPVGVGLDLVGLRKDGAELPVEIALSPTWSDGKLTITAVIRDIAARKETEREIGRLNESLRKRALQLEASNRELEAFSYSVSHDLRAPLRAIDGFSNALLKNYLDVLDARGQDYLQRVRAAAQRMAQLIDDILGLSRASRIEMERTTVDLSAMAADVVAELQRSQPERNAEIFIAPSMIVNADSHLLRIAMNNLLGNAWKFSGAREVTRIEVGAFDRNGERVYFVKDNGAGFDPEHADKLFSPFQRLHAESEFPGTGIGLALVQRIIHRHGGRIWAESVVDQGATFYFTLEEAQT